MNRIFLIKYLLAGSENRKPHVLYRLSKHSSKKIRRRVAENNTCPVAVLTALAADKYADVRIAVALNRKSSLETCMRLSKDPNPDVRFMMASASYMARQILETLACDESPYVKARAKLTLTRDASKASFVKKPCKITPMLQ